MEVNSTIMEVRHLCRGGGREVRVLRPFVGGEGDESRFAWKVESRDAKIK